MLSQRHTKTLVIAAGVLVVVVALYLKFSGKTVPPFELRPDLMDSEASALSPEDKSAIDQIMNDQMVEGFDKKDADKVVENVADDANFVNQTGRSFWGKETNRERHRVVFDASKSDHLLTKMKFVSELQKWTAYGAPVHTVVILSKYHYPEAEGATPSPGYDFRHPTQGQFTTVLARTNRSKNFGGWQIVSMQNTPTTPE